MKRLCRYLALLMRDERGGILIPVAVLLVVLLGMTALVIDVGALYVARRQMVNCADAAALAGAMENNKNRARDSAEAYAVKNGAENFNKAADVVISGNKDNEIINVRVSRQVDFTFARVLGYHSSTVGAVASAQRGPGNGLVPFAKIGHECGCEGLEEGEACEGSGIYRVKNAEGECAHPGDLIQLKFENWKDADFSSGNFGYVRLPGQKGGNDLRNDIAGGYDGDLETVQPGTVIREETGQSIGPLVQALEERMALADCIFSPTNPYLCDLVVIIPLVHTNGLTGASLPNNHVIIVGYASFKLELAESNNQKEVWANLVEYLTYEELLNILGPKLEGFIIRLVKVPPGVFQ